LDQGWNQGCKMLCLRILRFLANIVTHWKC